MSKEIKMIRSNVTEHSLPRPVKNKLKQNFRKFLPAFALVFLYPLLQVQSAQAQIDEFVPVTNDMLENPDPVNWLMWRRTLNTWGNSPLDQINTENVKQLKMVWTRGLSEGIQEGTALVYNGVMYFPNPSDIIQAIDVVTGDLLWEYRRRLPDDLDDYFPVSSINRNLAIYGNLIIDTSADDYIFALDAQSGELVWETKILDYQRGAQQTSGPIIANGKAISGRGCEPEGGPQACFIIAHDANTGEELWRTGTIPADGEPGDESWGDIAYEDRWHVGSWMVPSYDPELNLIYIGTSVTSPAPKFALAGNEYDYLYHNSTLAMNADTGEIVWYYQHLVDHWDVDHPFERLLVDTAVSPDPDSVAWINPNLQPGEMRKVLTGIPGKTGMVYTLDRETGEFLWANPTVYQTLISDIDGATGKVTVNPEVLFTEIDQDVLVCGGMAKGWPSGTYDPQSNVMFYPLRHTCGLVTSIMGEPSLDNLYGIIMRSGDYAPGRETAASVNAISVETGETLWVYNQRALMMSLTSTAGGLIFGGDAGGYMKALDQETGEVLWEINVGSPVSGYPTTFMVDGKQYLAISTGPSLYGSSAVSLAPELTPGNASNLFVFALPD